MITIGQLARYVGVSTKTIRVYHDKGLLTEPDRDASGYRRYGASHAIDLIKIRTLAEAGVPLARIRDLRSATDDEFRQALHQIDTDLSARIRDLRATQDVFDGSLTDTFWRYRPRSAATSSSCPALASANDG